MTNNLFSHYKNGSQISPFLIYQISTGNLYICSTETADETINVTSNKIRDLTLGRSTEGKAPVVCLINIVYESNKVVSVTLNEKSRLHCNGSSDSSDWISSDWIACRTSPFVNQNETDFIDSQMKNFQYCVSEINKFKELKEPFFKKMLISTISYLESLRLILGAEYGEDISAFDIARHNDYLERYNPGTWSNSSDKAIFVRTTINSIGMNAYFEHYLIVFKFELNPTTKVFNGVTLNSYEVV